MVTVPLILLAIGIARFSVSLFALLIVVVVVAELVIVNYGTVTTTTDSVTDTVASSVQSTSHLIGERAATIHISEFMSIMIILSIGVLAVAYRAITSVKRNRMATKQTR